MKKIYTPSPDEVLANMTANGGWTKATLAKWGVSWPPYKGWRKDLEKRYEKNIEIHKRIKREEGEKKRQIEKMTSYLDQRFLDRMS